MTERIIVRIDDHVAQVTLNRPDRHNALDRAMFDAIIETGRELADDLSVRAVILCGAGVNFCAGIDVSVFEKGEERIDAATLQALPGSLANLFQSAAYVWRTMPVPVIAALHGVVFGGGLQIALGADVRLVSGDARLSIMEIKWGLIPDMGISTVLPGLMAYDKAAELAWSGRVIGGHEAASLGLVTAVADEPLDAAVALARSIARNSPDAVRATKQLFREAWADRDAALLRREAELQSRVMAAPNQREAAAANLEKREPDFGDPAV